MATVLKFVETFKDKTFAEVPFCEADIVVGSIFSYASFEKTKEYEKHSLSNHTCRASVFNKPKTLNQMSENYLNPKILKNFLSQSYLLEGTKIYKLVILKISFLRKGQCNFLLLLSLLKITMSSFLGVRIFHFLGGKKISI